MTIRKELGKIKTASFGHGGYQDAMIGISFDLGGDGGWGVGDFWGHWDTECSEHCKWTEAERVKSLGETVMRISKLLRDAKKEHVHNLEGVPVEVSFDGDKLESWRVLTEVV